MRLRADGLLPRLFFACALAALAPLFARAQNNVPHIDKVEPPSWWAGHTVNPVRLLVRGHDLQHVTVRAADSTPFEVSGRRVNDAGTYMFVDLRVDPSARPGDYELVFSSTTGNKRVAFRINAPLDTATHFQGITTD